MTKYLISFPSEAMVVTADDFPVVVAESHAVIEEAKAAGVYVFGGGIAEDVAPVLVSADGSVGNEIYPGSELKGGFTVLELPTREDAVEWARKIAVACRCPQELREFGYDPASEGPVSPAQTAAASTAVPSANSNRPPPLPGPPSAGTNRTVPAASAFPAPARTTTAA